LKFLKSSKNRRFIEIELLLRHIPLSDGKHEGKMQRMKYKQGCSLFNYHAIGVDISVAGL